MPPHYGGMNIPKTPYSAPFVAILQANPVSGEWLAVLEAQFTPQGDGWYQLLPVGPFKARDGRPFDVASGHWQLDGQIAAALIACVNALWQDIRSDTTNRLSGQHRMVSLRQLSLRDAGRVQVPFS